MAQGAVQLLTRAVCERRAARKFAAKRTHPQVRQLQPMRIQPHSGMQTHACNACSARLKRYFFGLYVSLSPRNFFFVVSMWLARHNTPPAPPPPAPPPPTPPSKKKTKIPGGGET